MKGKSTQDKEKIMGLTTTQIDQLAPGMWYSVNDFGSVIQITKVNPKSVSFVSTRRTYGSSRKNWTSFENIKFIGETEENVRAQMVAYRQMAEIVRQTTKSMKAEFRAEFEARFEAQLTELAQELVDDATSQIEQKAYDIRDETGVLPTNTGLGYLGMVFSTSVEVSPTK